MNNIRILVADDHALVRRSIKALLTLEDDLEVVGAAENGLEAVSMAEDIEPDVIVMDIYMPQLDGIQAIDRLRQQHVEAAVVVLSSHVSATLVKQAFKNGATAYVLKRRATAELIPAIRAAHAGEIYFSAAIPSEYRSDAAYL